MKILSHLTPSNNIASFTEWWRRSWKKLQKHHRKGFNSLCIIGAWILWKPEFMCLRGIGPRICSELFKLSRRSRFFGVSLGLKGLLP